MMGKRKWHDITPETGDPNDLPSVNGRYLVTLNTGVVHEAYLDPCEPDQRVAFRRDVIAWREMPKPYRPSAPDGD